MSITEYLDLLPDIVSVKPFASQDKYGSATFAAATQHRARVLFKPHLIRTSEGEEKIARGEIWLGPPVDDLSDTSVPSLDTKSQIVFENSNLIILSFSRFPDEIGGHHLKIHFG